MPGTITLTYQTDEGPKQIVRNLDDLSSEPRDEEWKDCGATLEKPVYGPRPLAPVMRLVIPKYRAWSGIQF